MLKKLTIILLLGMGSQLFAAGPNKSPQPVALPTLSRVEEPQTHAPIITVPATTSPNQQNQTIARRNSLTEGPVKAFMGHSPTTKYVMISQRGPSSTVSPKKRTTVSPQTSPRPQKVSPTTSTCSPTTSLTRISPPPYLTPSPSTVTAKAQQTASMSPPTTGITPVMHVSPLRLDNSCKGQNVGAETVITITAANADAKKNNAIRSLFKEEEQATTVAPTDFEAQNKWLDDLCAMTDSIDQHTSAATIAKMRMAQLVTTPKQLQYEKKIINTSLRTPTENERLLPKMIAFYYFILANRPPDNFDDWSYTDEQQQKEVSCSVSFEQTLDNYAKQCKSTQAIAVKLDPITHQKYSKFIRQGYTHILTCNKDQQEYVLIAGKRKKNGMHTLSGITQDPFGKLYISSLQHENTTLQKPWVIYQAMIDKLDVTDQMPTRKYDELCEWNAIEDEAQQTTTILGGSQSVFAQVDHKANQ